LGEVLDLHRRIVGEGGGSAAVRDLATDARFVAIWIE
jgi:hypothetical protein